MTDVETASEMKEWFEKCKPMIKLKMRENIDLRAESVTHLINTCLNSIIFDTKSNNIMALISSHNESLSISSFELSALIHSSKQALYSKVDHWAGLTCSKRKPRYDIKSYFKNADNWWNRYKAEWIGDHFFYPLFHDILPTYIQNMLGFNDRQRYCSYKPDAMHIVSYDLIYFTILHAIFHEQISFARTKFLPLILDQCFNEKKCKLTVQHLLIALGDTHCNPWSITKGDNARSYAHKWVTDTLEKISCAYKAVVINTMDTPLYNDESEVKLEATGIINMPFCNPTANDMNYEQCQSKPLPYKHRQSPHFVPPPPVPVPYIHIQPAANHNYTAPIIFPSNNNNAYPFQETFINDTFPNLSSSSNATISTPSHTFERDDEFMLFGNLTPDPLVMEDCNMFAMESMDGFDQFNHHENTFDFL